MDEGPKLLSIPTKPDALAAGCELLKRDFDTLVSYHREIAKLRYQSFLAHKAAGFNDQQALELCRQ